MLTLVFLTLRHISTHLRSISAQRFISGSENFSQSLAHSSQTLAQASQTGAHWSEHEAQNMAQVLQSWAHSTIFMTRETSLSFPPLFKQNFIVSRHIFWHSMQISQQRVIISVFKGILLKITIHGKSSYDMRLRSAIWGMSNR